MESNSSNLLPRFPKMRWVGLVHRDGTAFPGRSIGFSVPRVLKTCQSGRPLHGSGQAVMSGTDKQPTRPAVLSRLSQNAAGSFRNGREPKLASFRPHT